MKTAFLIFFACFLSLHAQDLLIADFEGNDYGDWKVVGTAFGDKPARGTLPNQMHVSEYQGHGLVNSYNGGDSSVGKLISPVFTLKHSYIRFLIGGGGWDDTRMDLLAETEPNVFSIVRTARGSNVKPGGSEALRPEFWDVHEWKGKRVRIEIVDDHRGGWGHINVDHIVATDEKPRLPRYNVEFEMVVTKPWLLLPVSNTERNSTLTIHDGDALLHSISVRLSDKPTWHPAMDMSAHLGKKLQFVIDRIPPDSKFTESFIFSDTPSKDDNPYGESLRPLIHFTPYRGWNNDPNGLVFYNGEYHMFFQHNPYGINWGNMHWGHAVSKDLFQWTELPDALSPDPLGPMFSGSAVVDTNNTSGFGEKGIAPLILIYTAAGNPAVQCIAYSLDGRIFTKYSDNPVLPNQTGGNRDPKVIWHEPTRSWIMALYVTRPNNTHTVELWGSKNLKNWTKRSVVQGGTNGSHFLYECPELFEIPLDGTNETRWIVYGANGEYAVGQFDGTTFTPETSPLPGHRGRNLYASQTFNNEPLGRRI
ncbi:MAG: glycoside hydrolase family 32 protein, partial [Victivallales bacterium]|nr:glycoside hydrolase family 32 protein [Victivallales bacterium]